MATDQAPLQVQGVRMETSAGPAGEIPTPDYPNRYFEYDKTEREALLRGMAETSAVRNALENVFASIPWLEQRGELDRFHLHALIETVREEGDREYFHCKFSGCPYKNRESTNTVEHVRGSHFGNRPFLCPEPDCGRAFTRRHDLQTHQQTHSRSNNFRCRFCEGNFTRMTNRTRHERHSHPERYEEAGATDQASEDLSGSED